MSSIICLPYIENIINLVQLVLLDRPHNGEILRIHESFLNVIYFQNHIEYMDVDTYSNNQSQFSSDEDVDYESAENLTKIENLPIIQNLYEVECPICLEKIEINSQVIKLHCEHIFHKQCIKKWLKVKSSCPYCRIMVL